MDADLLRTFRDPKTETARAVLDRGDSRIVIDDGVRAVTASSACENECENSDCGFGEERVESVYEKDFNGDCVLTGYDCGC